MKQRMDSDEFATVAFLQQGKIRYEAQWIKKQAFDSSGELDPDNDEYGYSQHASREQAERSAIIASKKTQVEWIHAMIRFLQRLRLYCKGTGLTREKYEAMALRSHSARNRRLQAIITACQNA